MNSQPLVPTTFSFTLESGGDEPEKCLLTMTVVTQGAPCGAYLKMAIDNFEELVDRVYSRSTPESKEDDT